MLRFNRFSTQPLEALAQPVPLVKMAAQSSGSSVQHVAVGITAEAEQLLRCLTAPLYIAAFAGFGRSGKSYTATKVRQAFVGDSEHVFLSQPGNVPCTHGIDMLVFKNPSGPGHVIFLDCEGGANHNQTALPVVIGLAARLATHFLVFERGCFTTNGLETVMQVINMGMATSRGAVDITRSLTLVENMTINETVAEDKLLDDLLSPEDGDEQTNTVRQLIKDRFEVELAKLPFRHPGNEEQHDKAVQHLSDIIANRLTPLIIGNVPVDGPVVAQLVQELVTQIRDGGNRFNMVSATEALVSNMASEAANSVWTEFVSRVKKAGNHPKQINGRKHLRTIMREVEGTANTSLNELESFVNRLVPEEPAKIARQTWDRNYTQFENEIKSVHQQKSEQLTKYTQWADKISQLVNEIIAQVLEAIRQLIRFARFSTSVLFMSNYYFWKHSLNLVTGLAQGMMSPS